MRYPSDLRQDLESLRRVLIPVRPGAGAASPAMSAQGGMGGAAMETGSGSASGMQSVGGPQGSASAPSLGIGGGVSFPAERRGAYVPLGQVARIQVVNGPPMIRDEAGMLVGYVYVDMDANRRDIGGYVDQAKRAIAHEVKLPAGYFLKWTGQYELLEQMQGRMKIPDPAHARARARPPLPQLRQPGQV